MILGRDQDPLYIPGPTDWLDVPPADGAAPILDPWQSDWVGDRSRFLMALKCRQSGYSFATSLALVTECWSKPKTPWICLSRGQRQSDELLEKCAMHIEALDAVVEMLTEDVYCESIADSVTIRTIRFENGSKIIGLPANADTARGLSGNVFLDEFAFHRDARAIKAALIPVITRGYRIAVVSTPNGKSGPFYEMWTDRKSAYTKHRIDIYEVAARGIHLRPDIDELRQAMADDELFAQEYECVFLDEGTAFIPHELITNAESDRASIDGLLAEIGEPAFAGADIGRRRDQTVIWICGLDAEKRRTTRRVVTLRNTPFEEQERICSEIAAKCGRFAIDETGLGMMLAENLQRRHGAKVIPVTFTVAEKEDMAVRLKRALEDRTFLLPADRTIRASFHSIKRLPGSGGHFRFDAERTEDTGHADSFWAAALCERAASMTACKPEYRAVLTRKLAGYFRRDGDKAKPDERFPRARTRAATPGNRWGTL